VRLWTVAEVQLNPELHTSSRPFPQNVLKIFLNLDFVNIDFVNIDFVNINPEGTGTVGTGEEPCDPTGTL